MTAGEWHENVWCTDSWHEDVWTDYGTAVAVAKLICDLLAIEIMGLLKR